MKLSIDEYPPPKLKVPVFVSLTWAVIPVHGLSTVLKEWVKEVR